VKYVKFQIADILAHLINLSFRVGYFPSQLKIAKVTVLHKKGDKTSPANYRPISVLPVFSKIFERAIYDQLYLHIAPVIARTQYGFLPGSSTEMALLELKEHILHSINGKSNIGAVVIDFAKGLIVAIITY